jgi:hypothetical protein
MPRAGWQRDCIKRKVRRGKNGREGGEHWEGTGNHNSEETLNFGSLKKEKKDNEKKEV